MGIGAATGRKFSSADLQRRQAAVAMIERYDGRLRRTARRYSLCADDADDAYQQALEILLRKAPAVEPERLVRWMHTVTRHEAYAVRRQRDKLLGGNRTESQDGSEVDVIDLIPSNSPEPDVGAERSEKVARGFEALRSLKPQEIRTLTLKAEGYSYEEIGEITGFSHTKINRCMVEGRRRFLERFSAIEAGDICDELSAAVSAFADGELEDKQRPDLIRHLSGCAHCRAKLRGYRAVPRQVLSLAPVAMLGGPPMVSRAADRLLAAGERTKEAAASLLQRGGGAVDASQTVASSGGTRGSGLAVLGVICGLGAAGGGAAVCVDKGVLPNSIDGGNDVARVVPAPEVPIPMIPPVSAPVKAPDPVAPAPNPTSPEPVTPTQQRERELGFEQQVQQRASSGTSSSEFGGPSTSSGGSGSTSGGTSSGSAGGFGIEK